MTRRRLPTPEDLEPRLGYRFRNPRLLQEALTHRSEGLPMDNQRLEFLGDGLLTFLVAQSLFEARPDWQEGAMSRLRGQLVQTRALHAWAVDLGLPGALRVAHSRKSMPMGMKPVADALEAVLAAVYLDARAAGEDPLAATRSLVEARFLPTIQEARSETLIQKDPKSNLKETAERRGMPAPTYTLLGQSGPDHAPRFRVRADLGDLSAEAEAGTRKGAEVEAALHLLEALRGGTNP